MKLNTIMPWTKESPFGQRAGADPLALFHRQVDNLFDNFFNTSLGVPWQGRSFAPDIDVSESEKEVRVIAELPGLDEKDVEVTLADNILTLKGEKKEEQEEEKNGYHHSERSYGLFERSVRLPEGADTEKAEAKFKNGILRVSIPKKPGAATARRKIELKAE